uniref:Uncharacterized protein n=1 Tax=uncultured marine virus TaxID=186617 RepID=A0A0F7LA77_9VIRU|nr:hypothetical protein [uncultured marine virus]
MSATPPVFSRRQTSGNAHSPWLPRRTSRRPRPPELLARRSRRPVSRMPPKRMLQSVQLAPPQSMHLISTPQEPRGWPEWPPVERNGSAFLPRPISAICNRSPGSQTSAN